MFKKINCLSLFLLAAITLIGCSKDESAHQNKLSLNPKNSSVIDYENIGIQHNIGLSKIYESLRLQNDLSKFELDYLEAFAADQSAKYITDHKDYGGIAIDVNNLINENSFLFTTDEQSEMTEKLRRKILDNLSDVNSITYFNDFELKMKELQGVERENVAVIVNDLKILEAEIDRNVIEQDLPILKSMVVTARYSIDYWDKNFEQWIQLGNPDYEYQTSDWDWFSDTIGDMAVADAWGAGVGALVALPSLAAGPAGLVAVAASAVAGGCRGSAVQGIRALYNRISS